MAGLDSDLIRYAIDTARERGFRQFKIKLGDDSFSATLSVDLCDDQVAESDSLTEGETVQASTHEPVETTVEAPAVGYFRANNPPLELGAVLSAGDKVGEIVALGLANDVNVKVDGEIVELFVEDGAAVEYGQSIMMLRQKV